ncbi:MAG: phosphoenolpyruvate--protein phosphotransferase [Lachnospiraceae bacterium]|nr:phosphoenolpyruvate--protein phosphotransferase [Lachnospiraceae bacterium]
MLTITGQSISSEIAIGMIRFYRHKKNIVNDAVAADPDGELSRYQVAYHNAMEQLQLLHDKTLEQIGAEEAEIFEMHRMLLSDRQFHHAILHSIIQDHKTAEYAIYSVGEELWNRFIHMEDPYIQARGADIQDIMNRLLFLLSGKKESSMDATEPFILMAEDLSPSETVQLNSAKLLGFITRQGSPYSHTAILAKTMNVPALMHIDIKESWDGHPAIIDGEKQCVYIDPPKELIEKYRIKQASMKKKRAELHALKTLPAVTLDGHSVAIYANINAPADIKSAIDQGSEGIGLFRSEFLYLNTQEYPDEEVQYQIYRRVLEQMPGKHVVIRTLDLGADKKSPYLALEPEENPALGYRAIRICLSRPELFKIQLRALLRAGAHGQLHIMFPMITSLWEVRRAKELVTECKAELSAEQAVYGNPILGIMIETPAAVMVAEDLAKEVDFFSIGTNDLAQYTLALDRNNAKLHDFFDPHHPALIRMIRMVVDAAHKEGIPVSICGESGADLTLTRTFMEMGIDALSVAPNSILPLKKAIREISLN